MIYSDGANILTLFTLEIVLPTVLKLIQYFELQIHTIAKAKVTSISINQFKNNLQALVKQVIQQHIPLKITSQDGADFVVVSAEDWEQQQETLFVLQNSYLMQQITRSMATHAQNQGYHPNQEELNEILSF